MGIRTTTQSFNGSAAEAVQEVAISDNGRRYIGLYSLTNTCKVSFGDGTHASTYLSIAAGNLLEIDTSILDRVYFSTTGAVLRVIQDIDSKVILSSDSLTMTSDGLSLYYSSADSKPRNPAPIFS